MSTTVIPSSNYVIMFVTATGVGKAESFAIYEEGIKLSIIKHALVYVIDYK